MHAFLSSKLNKIRALRTKQMNDIIKELNYTHTRKTEENKSEKIKLEALKDSNSKKTDLESALSREAILARDIEGEVKRENLSSQLNVI